MRAKDNWKAFLNTIVAGGFDNRKHPVYIESAIANAERNYTLTDNVPDESTTEVFFLGQKILPLIKEDIDLILRSK